MQSSTNNTNKLVKSSGTVKSDERRYASLKRKVFLSRYASLILFIVLGFSLRMLSLHTRIERNEGSFGIQRKLLFEKGHTSFLTNKPPLLTLTYALTSKIFGNSIIPIRLINDLLFLIAIILFYFFISKSQDKNMAFVSTLFFILLMNLPFLKECWLKECWR